MPEPATSYQLDFKKPSASMSIDRERLIELASVLKSHPQLAGRIFTAMRNGETRRELAAQYGAPYSRDDNGRELYK